MLEPRRWDLCTLFDVNYQPARMSPGELQEGMYWLTERLYNDECTRFRRRGFFALTKAHRNTEAELVSV